MRVWSKPACQERGANEEEAVRVKPKMCLVQLCSLCMAILVLITKTHTLTPPSTLAKLAPCHALSDHMNHTLTKWVA